MPRISITTCFIAGVWIALFISPLARCESADPAASRISGFYEILLDTMQRGRQLGLKGRYEKLAPVLSKTYDLASMARIAVGSSWNGLSAQKQLEIVNAFTRMTVATYASRFDDFSGERFEISQTVDQPNGDKIVKTHIIQTNGKTVALNYLMRKSGVEWKIMDVYLDGVISELASRRSEFGAVLKSGGPDALVNSLMRQGDKLLAGRS